MNTLKFNDFLKTKNKTKNSFLQFTKSPHFPLIRKVGQLSKRKSVLCWSMYIYYKVDFYDKHNVCHNTAVKYFQSLSKIKQMLYITASGGCQNQSFPNKYIYFIAYGENFWVFDFSGGSNST